MKYNKEYIQDLLDKFMSGQTTENEEQKLSEFFANTEDIPAEWMPYKEMFQSFMTDAYDFSEEELEKMLQPEPAKKSRIISVWPWLSAACVAAVVVMFILHPWSNTTVSEQPTVAQVNPTKEAQGKDSIENKKDVSIKETSLAVVPSLSGEQDVAAKKHVPATANKTSTQKHQKAKKAHPVEPTSTHEQDISTSELLETTVILADISPEDAYITVSPADKGFVVRTVSTNGQSNSYMLRRCSNGTSIVSTSHFKNL